MSLLYQLKPMKDKGLRPLLSFLQRSGVTPNMVTILGTSLSLLAGLGAALGHLNIGIALFIASACLDALDGSLARFSDNCTEFGRFFDSVCDRVSETAFIGGAVIGGSPSAMLLIALGSMVLLVTRIGLHLKGNNSNSAWFSRPERLAIIIIGLLFPTPYSTLIFTIGSMFCIISSAHVALSSKESIINLIGSKRSESVRMDSVRVEKNNIEQQSQ
jgi:CDP-diacylglycerol--glycerol-3-phosphate 3-phosphatidyltransferase